MLLNAIRDNVRALTLLLTLLFTGTATSVLAVAPCHESCHLAQGTPLLLSDANLLLMTRCDRVKDDGGVSSTCVTEQLSLEGRVLRRLPRVPRLLSDDDFTKTYLSGHAIVKLAWQSPWTNLSRPYVLNELFTHQRLTLSLTGSKLICSAPAKPTITRDLACTPSELRVFASMGHDMVPRRPVVVVGVCRPDAITEHEVVTVCMGSESQP